MYQFLFESKLINFFPEFLNLPFVLIPTRTIESPSCGNRKILFLRQVGMLCFPISTEILSN